MISLKLSTALGTGIRQRVLVPAIEAQLLAGRKVLVVCRQQELQTQFESYFTGPAQPVVSTSWRVTNRAFGLGEADLVVLDSLHGDTEKQLTGANPRVEFWLINPSLPRL